MRIWYITSEFPPSYGGGIGTYIDIISKKMADEGNDVIVFIRDQKNLVERISENLLYIRFSPKQTKISSHHGYWCNLSFVFYEIISDYIENHYSPDIIEVPDYNGLGYYLIKMKYLYQEKFGNVKIIVHEHTPQIILNRINKISPYKQDNYFIQMMERFSLLAADAVIAQSNYLKNALMPYTPYRESIPVIPLPYLDEEKQQNKHSKEEIELLVEKQNFLYIGRIEYRKGITKLLESLNRLWNSGSDIKLIAIGGDTFFTPKNASLRSILEEKYRDKITEGLLEFHDSVSPEELIKIIRTAKAVIIPSLFENFPYTNIMAMWEGVPVLVSKQGGQAEAVGQNYENGIIFDWEIKGDCEKNILYVNNLSSEELTRLGQNGKKRIRSLCGLEGNFKERQHIYTEIIENPEKYKNKAIENSYPFINQIKPTPYYLQNNFTEEGLLTIIIPYYNLGETIIETIQSVFASTYMDKEVIIINDGSTDKNSIEKLIEIEAEYPQTIIINIENGGLANARNVGAENAHGEYISFLDADDRVAEKYYEKCIEILKKYGSVSFVYSWLEYFGASTSIWTTFDTHFPYMLFANQLAAFAVVRKNDFLAFGKNDIKMEYSYEDYDSWLSMVENGYYGICIPEPMCFYRIRDDSMIRSASDNSKLIMFERIVENHANSYQQYSSDVINLLRANIGNNGNAQLEEIKKSRIYRLQQKYYDWSSSTPLGRVFRKLLLTILDKFIK